MVLSGAGDKAFCTGGDQKVHLSEDGLYGPRGTVGMPIEEMQTALRDLRKVSIAKVQGFAIGGGNVFATICDLTIASEKATFGQVGPKVGSADPGWGTAYLARIVGERRRAKSGSCAAEYTANEAAAMGLVNKVVPHEQLDAEVAQWCKEINEMSPTALTIIKRSFAADTEHIRGISFQGIQTVKHYYQTEESKEGVRCVQRAPQTPTSKVRQLKLVEGHPFLRRQPLTELIRSELESDGVLLATIDMPDRTMNVFSFELMDALDALMDRVESDDAVRAVVLTSGKPSFLAGADLVMVKGYCSEARRESHDHMFESLRATGSPVRATGSERQTLGGSGQLDWPWAAALELSMALPRPCGRGRRAHPARAALRSAGVCCPVREAPNACRAWWDSNRAWTCC